MSVRCATFRMCKPMRYANGNADLITGVRQLANLDRHALHLAPLIPESGDIMTNARLLSGKLIGE